jgi:hypothetical protein
LRRAILASLSMMWVTTTPHRLAGAGPPEDRPSPAVGVWPQVAGPLSARGTILLTASVDTDDIERVLARVGLTPVLVPVNGRPQVPLEIVSVDARGSVAGELQILLRPRAPLEPGQRHALRLGAETFWWTVERHRQPAPRWRGPPRQVAGAFDPGDLRSVRLPVDAAERIRVRATALDTGSSIERVVRPLDRSGDIGRKVRLWRDGEYRLDFWAMDAAGNEVRAPSALRITVSAGVAETDRGPTARSGPDDLSTENLPPTELGSGSAGERALGWNLLAVLGAVLWHRTRRRSRIALR